MVQTESRSRSRRQRAEQAVAHALERRWDLAAEVNRALLQEEPDDIETANRLGKALTELGDLLDAAGAYARTLEIDPTNAIARKNIARIEELIEVMTEASLCQLGGMAGRPVASALEHFPEAFASPSAAGGEA